MCYEYLYIKDSILSIAPERCRRLPNMMMEINQKMNSPRFGQITVTRKYDSMREALLDGFSEPSGITGVKGRIVDSYSDKNGCGWCKFEWCVVE